MREYIFTEDDRRRLTRWLETGEEDQVTRNLFVQIRRSVPSLAEDMDLLLRVVKAMQRLRRWRGYVTGRGEFGSALRRGESALTRARRGAAT